MPSHRNNGGKAPLLAPLLPPQMLSQSLSHCHIVSLAHIPGLFSGYAQIMLSFRTGHLRGHARAWPCSGSSYWRRPALAITIPERLSCSVRYSNDCRDAGALQQGSEGIPECISTIVSIIGGWPMRHCLPVWHRFLGMAGLSHLGQSGRLSSILLLKVRRLVHLGHSPVWQLIAIPVACHLGHLVRSLRLGSFETVDSRAVIDLPLASWPMRSNTRSAEY